MSTAARTLMLVVCGAAWLLCASPDARAQSPDSASADSRARVDQLLAQGIASREAGRDAEALEFYRQAVALQPENPRALAHLAATYQALGRWVPAHNHLLQALQYREDPYIQRHRAELEEALATVDDHIGFLEVYGAPAGAEALINGQLVAELPMSAPVPVTVGSYLLEVRLQDHYTLGRPITISKRGLTREEVELSPHRSGATLVAAAPKSSEAPQDAAEAGSSLSWLPWTLGGLSVAAAVTSVIAWDRREYYADRWNDDEACVGVGVSRQEQCGDELEKGQNAETVMWISAGAAGVFAAGAVISAVLLSSGEEKPVASLRCAPGLWGAQCFGTF